MKSALSNVVSLLCTSIIQTRRDFIFAFQLRQEDIELKRKGECTHASTTEYGRLDDPTEHFAALKTQNPSIGVS